MGVEMDKLLSCDSIPDAIRSLADFYQLDVSRIWDIYESSWPEFLCNFEIFGDERLAWCLGKYLNATDDLQWDFKACYYHRSRYNGRENWFREGLLNNCEGVKALFSKLRFMQGWSPAWDVAEDIAMKVLIFRDSDSVDRQGPHAFSVLEEALSTNDFDYTLPEFLSLNLSEWQSYQDLKKVVSDFIVKNTHPVIVKFSSTPTNFNVYINDLWRYLSYRKFGHPLENEFQKYCGNGMAIPFSDIIQFIQIDS